MESGVCMYSTHVIHTRVFPLFRPSPLRLKIVYQSTFVKHYTQLREFHLRIRILCVASRTVCSGYAEGQRMDRRWLKFSRFLAEQRPGNRRFISIRERGESSGIANSRLDRVPATTARIRSCSLHLPRFDPVRSDRDAQVNLSR